MSPSTETTQEKKSIALGHGDFVWYELVTSDLDAAETFYSRVVGWHLKDAGVAGMRYSLIHAGETAIGGMMAMHGAPPGWLGYIAVDDVDRYAERVQQGGGTIHRPPQDIPNIGRFSVVADPQGAIMILFKGNSPTPPTRPAPNAPGFVGWHELSAAEWQSDFAFYADLLGWRKTEAIDMGPMGTYQTFSTNDGPMNGGAMTQPAGVPGAPGPHWTFYFTVDDIRTAIDRIKAEGGQIVHGPSQVPGGSWIVQGRDPQGAFFALVSMKG